MLYGVYIMWVHIHTDIDLYTGPDIHRQSLIRVYLHVQ